MNFSKTSFTKRKYTLILIPLSFTLLSTINLLFPKEGLNSYSYNLKDGESIKIDSLINLTQNEDLIVKNSLPNLNSAIIRSFETDSNSIMDLVTYSNSILANRNIGYWSLIPIGFSRVSAPVYAFWKPEGYDWKKISAFQSYYHSMFKNKTARTFLFNQALYLVSSLCKSYPSDFKKLVIKELDQLLLFTNSLETISPWEDTDNFNDYWKGFLFRRHHIDNIPVSEIQNSILNAQLKIKSIDVSKQPDTFYEININNQITLFFSSEKYSIYSKSNAKEISFNYANSIQQIRYFKDNTGDYYQITGFKDSEPFKHLYNLYLDEID